MLEGGLPPVNVSFERGDERLHLSADAMEY